MLLALFLAVFSSGLVQLYRAEAVHAVSEDHIVICHKTGSGYNLVPPANNSAHAADTQDFLIESTFSNSQIWDSYKADYQKLCDAGPTATTPLAPTFTDVCGTANDQYVIPSQVGIAYYVNGSTTATAAGTYAATGTVTIVAKPLYGQILKGTTSWSQTFAATPACTVSVAPVAPSVSAACGPNNDVVILPTQTGVTYTSSGWVNNSLTVTATAQTGYTLSGTSSWTFVDGNITCPQPVTPVAPTITPITACGTYGSIVMATTPGVTYTLTVGDGKQGAYTVTATAQTGYYFNEGATASWSGNLGTYFACLSVTPCEAISGPTVVSIDTQFADSQDTRSAGHYAITADGLHIWTDNTTSQAKVAWYHAVDYSLSAVGAPSMEYTANSGIQPGLQLVVDFDGNGTPDGILVGESVYGNNWWLSNSAAQFVKDGAPHNGSGYGSNWYGTLSDWLTYFPSAKVKAVGFSLGSGVLADGTLYSLTFGCHKWVFHLVPTTVPAPLKDDTCYADNDWYFIPKNTTGVEYLVNGEVVAAGWYHATGSVTVTARVLPGYSVPVGTVLSWTMTFTDEHCITITKSPVAYVDRNGNGIVDLGDVTTWTITLTNTSTESLSESFLDDHFYVMVTDTGATLDTSRIDELAPSASVTITATKPLTSSDITACQATNTALFSAWRLDGETSVETLMESDPTASASASARLVMNCARVLGTTTTTTTTTPTPKVLPATIANTGASQTNSGLILGLMLSALTYYVMLRRQEQN